jgi:Icc protein
MSRYIEHGNEGDDDIDRRGFLKCMARAGTGVVFALSGCGEVATTRLGANAAPHARSSFTFVQISDSHVGFDKPANPDVVHTLEQCIARINALPQRPSFVVHTGDHVHLSTPEEFDTVKQLLGTIKAGHVFHVPGEHDVFVDQGKRYRQFFGKGSRGTGYYSFDEGGVHFLALANVQASEAESGGATNNGLGVLGAEQLAFIKKDLAARSSDTPIVIFGHVPLLAVYPKWGWATKESAQVLKLLKRFGSVTALNGHIHQLIEKTEGKIVMHTAASTAYPLHPPGDVAPEPLVVPAGTLPSRIGIRTVHFVRGSSSIALKDQSLVP